VKDLEVPWGKYSIIDQRSRDNIFILLFTGKFQHIKEIEGITKHEVYSSDAIGLLFIGAVRGLYSDD
jgi:hypothetical protein